jgi:rubrerythrin
MAFSRTPLQVRWVKPAGSFYSPDVGSAEDNLRVPGVIENVGGGTPQEGQSDLLFAIQREGLPEIPGATPEEELAEFLRAAAEVEHGLMVQYLFAAEGTSNLEVSATLKGIAIEEMGHLMTVQNVLLAIDQEPYLGRYDKVTPTFSPFTLKFEPATRQSIAKYASCERPGDLEIDPEDRDIVQQLEDDAKLSTGGKIPDRVGLLYAKIYWLLRESDDPVQSPDVEAWEGYPVVEIAKMHKEHGRSDFHVHKYPTSESPLQGVRTDWYGSNQAILILSAKTRSEARKAIADISAQGEGFARVENGHFDRFVEVYRKTLTTEITRNVATNPWYPVDHHSEPEGGSQITYPLALDCAMLGDQLYELILICIFLGIHPSQVDSQQRSAYATFAVRHLMVGGLKMLLAAMNSSGLQVTSEPDSKLVSIPYTMPSEIKDISDAYLRFKQAVVIAKQISDALSTSSDISISIAAADISAMLDNAPQQNSFI